MDLVSDTAFVTGGARGIGKGIATKLSEHGAAVSVADIDVEEAERTAAALRETYGTNAFAVECDVTDAESITRAVDRTVEEFGDIGILVNNAGSADMVRIWEMDEKDWDTVFDVTLKSTFLCTKTVLQQMFESDLDRGAIVNISSLNYLHATDGFGAYCAAKAGVSQLTKVVAGEVGRYGITVNCVAPGSTRTHGTEGEGQLDGKSGEEFLKRTVLGDRFGLPEDIAKVVAFFASDYADWITGETICVDGGQHIRGLHSYWDVHNEMGNVDNYRSF